MENDLDSAFRARLEAMDPVQVCARRGGIASFAQLRGEGVSRAALTRATDAQELIRIRRGLYSLPTVSTLTQDEVRLGLTRTCVSALKAHGLPVRTQDSRSHLAAPRGKSFGGRHARPTKRNIIHYFPEPIASSRSVLAALDSASRCLSRVDQLAAIDAALNRDMVDIEDLAGLRVTPRRRAAWLRKHCDPGAQSPPETWTRVAMVTAGLAVESQVVLPGVGRVDFVVDNSVCVEVDGQTYHMNERSFGEDRRRDRVTQVAGLLALRFTRRDVEYEMDMVIDTIVAAVNIMRLRAGKPTFTPRPFACS